MYRVLIASLAILTLTACRQASPGPSATGDSGGPAPSSPTSAESPASVETVQRSLDLGENAAALAALDPLAAGGENPGVVASLRAEALLALRERDEAASAARSAIDALGSAAADPVRDAALARAWRVLAECDVAALRLDEAAAHVASAAPWTPATDPASAAMLERVRARVALWSGDTLGAEVAAESALRLLEGANLAESWRMGAALAARATVWQRIMDKVNRTPDEFAAAARILLATRAADDAEVAETVETAVNLLEGRRRFDEAGALAEEWVRAAEQRPGPRRPWAIELARCRRAHGLIREGRFDEAQRVLEGATAAPVADAPAARVARSASLAELADVHRRLKNYALAHDAVDQALAVFAAAPARPVEIEADAFAKTILGWITIDEGDHLAAEPILEAAADALRRTAGEMNWKTGLARALLGETRMRQGRFDEAEEDMAYGARILITYRGPDTDAYRAIRLCAEMYEAWGKPDLASLYRERLPFTENSPASPD
ncbi:MAG: hypothetical protein IT450_15275 [Phycisphaerales bacterium]|nr:hypothetical protein [Phycisphaerales bacterium]